MKVFVSALTLGLILAFAAPAFAGTTAPKTKTEQSKPAKTTKALKFGAEIAIPLEVARLDCGTSD